MATTQPKNNSIKVANPDLSDQPRTYLTQDVAAGAVALTVASISGFPGTGASDFYVLIGDYGDEKAEIKLIDASETSGKVFTIAALTSSHEASDPVTVIEFNQVKYYQVASSSAEPGITDVAIATLDIDPTAQLTEYVNTDTNYSYFVTAYFHENSEFISGFSENVYAGVFTRRSAERVIQSGALKALTTIDENANSRLSWDIALTVLQDGLDEVAARKKRWPFWNTIPTATTVTADQAWVAKPSDLTQLVRIKVNGYELDWFSGLDYNRYSDGVTGGGKPTHFTEKNERYYFHPTPDSAYSLEYEYYKIPDVISDMSTAIDIPLVPVLIYYCGSQFAYIRGNDKRGDKLYQMYVKLLEEQVEEYSGPGQDGVAEYVETTSMLNENPSGVVGVSWY